MLYTLVIVFGFVGMSGSSVATIDGFKTYDACVYAGEQIKSWKAWGYLCVEVK
jgi:hypothetical protein